MPGLVVLNRLAKSELTQNWPLKLGAIGVAALLWIGLVGSSRSSVRLGTKEVPLEIRLKGKPADGYHVARLTSVPDRVQISGPSAQLESVTGAPLEVDITARQESFQANSTVAAPVAGMSIVPPVEVQVQVVIEKGNSLHE